jgi:hypothetical protein
MFKMIRDVLPELILALTGSLPSGFIALAHEPVDWTKYSIVRFRFVPKLFDQEFCAAVLTLRLKNEFGNVRSHRVLPFLLAPSQKAASLSELIRRGSVLPLGRR